MSCRRPIPILPTNSKAPKQWRITIKKSTRNYLALDVGAESGRGIVGEYDGKTIRLKEVHRFDNSAVCYLGNHHWDVLHLASNLTHALTAAVTAACGEIVSLGIDTWGVDYVLMDKRGGLLGYPCHYRHPRNLPAMNSVVGKLGKKRIFRRTGLQFLPFNTLFQLYAEKQNGIERLDAADKMLFIPDFLTYAFGGEMTSEYTIASTSQMLDVHRRTWSKAMLGELGLPTKILPHIVMPGTNVGKISEHVVKQTGAQPSLKLVAPCRHDTAAAVAAVPAQGTGWAYLSSGTWSLLGVELNKPLVNDDVLRHGFTNEGGLENTIRLLTNIMGLWLVQELRREWMRQGRRLDYASLTRQAEKSKPFGPLVAPNWEPFGRPSGMPRKIEEFCRLTGQVSPRTEGQFVRCAMESLAMAYRRAKEKLETLTGQTIHTIHCVGGGSKNDLLNQMTANACKCQVLAGPVEATALGNILGQMLADRKITSLSQGRSIIRHSVAVRRFKPDDRDKWNDAYSRYLKILHQIGAD